MWNNAKYLIAILAATKSTLAIFPINPYANDFGAPTYIGRRPNDAAALSSSSVQSYNLSVPVDHFHNDSQYEPHSNEFYNLRYFLETSYYKPGGPVIVIASGETSAENRVPYLVNGIGSLLGKATGGVILTLEHRYYGTSFPVPDLSNTNYRFLTTEQAIADTAYFARNVQFPGLEDIDLTAPKTPWIIYGGSYAGAFAAFTRKLYPDTYLGAISSSGVTQAIFDYWEYNEAARLFAPGDCGPVMSKVTHIVDTALFSGSADKVKTVKKLFAVDSTVSNERFGNSISHPSSALQSESWLRGQSDTTLQKYCAKITSTTLQYPNLANMRATAQQLAKDAGYGKDVAEQMLNYAGLQRPETLRMLKRSECQGLTQHDCLSNSFQKRDTAELNDGYSWFYQTCTQWGYYVSGNGVPKNILGILSRAVTLNNIGASCKRTFNVTGKPNVESINRLGGINFSYPRVAVIDGKQDPWRAATPHKIGANANRNSTTEQPFILIDPATHHWDEDDIPASEYEPGYPPQQIVDVHDQEVAFVKAWLEEFNKPKD